MPFNRLGQENSTIEGTGIGLVVTKRLVELMGGSIGAESTAGIGSKFWFELNFIPAHDRLPADNGQCALTEQVTSSGSKIRTVLYVEDDPANIKLIELIFARQPEIKLITATNGRTGVELALASRPNLILLDINLPDISGFEVMNILQSEPSTANIPVIAVSANAMPHDVEKGLRSDFFEYITKPVRVSELKNAVDKALAYSDTMMLQSPN
jgi:CheY-like chemotaxis protein